MSSTIDVHIRVLPTKESAWRTGPTHLAAKNRPESFQFSQVHGPNASNGDVFRTICPMVSQVMYGVNVTVMAYGQTGSGKTHTMVGNGVDDGVFFLASSVIMKGVAAHEPVGLRATYIEIYNEVVRDLLANPPTDLEVRENGDRDVVIDKLSWYSFNTLEELQNILRRTKDHWHERSGASTFINNRSSRSHTILTIEMVKFGTTERVGGVLNLVDLAGSECASRANTAGVQLREGGYINKSLLALGNVVDAIVDSRPHIPYRESKLTRILSNSLGGSAQTAIICCINPEPGNFDQSIAVMRFARRAQRIKQFLTCQITQPPACLDEIATKYEALVENTLRAGEAGYRYGVETGMRSFLRGAQPFFEEALIQFADEANQIEEEEKKIWDNEYQRQCIQLEENRAMVKAATQEKLSVQAMVEKAAVDTRLLQAKGRTLDNEWEEDDRELMEVKRAIAALDVTIAERDEEIRAHAEYEAKLMESLNVRLAAGYKAYGTAMQELQALEKQHEINEQRRLQEVAEQERARIECEQLDHELGEVEHESSLMRVKLNRARRARDTALSTSMKLADAMREEAELLQQIESARAELAGMKVSALTARDGNRRVKSSDSQARAPQVCVQGELSMILEGVGAPTPGKARGRKRK